MNTKRGGGSTLQSPPDQETDLMTPQRKAAGRFRAFLRATRGNIAIILCFALFVVAGCMGAAVDYIRLVRERTAFAAAADAAVLAAVSSAKYGDTSGVTDPTGLARSAARKAWDANLLTSAVREDRDPTIDVAKTEDGAWSVSVSYDTLMPSSFVNILGLKWMRIAGKVSARGGSPATSKYWDIHLAVDTSSSMGLGATPADMTAMKSKFDCEFACHTPVVSFKFSSTYPRTYTLSSTASPFTAHNAGIKLRIDIVDQAIDALVGVMKGASDGGSIRAKLWGINVTAKDLVNLTASLDDVAAYTLTMPTESESVGDTNYMQAMARLTAEVGATGTGQSAASPRKAVFLVTDGMHDSSVWTPNYINKVNASHYLGAMDPAFCSELKAQGVLVGVLYIDYYEAPSHVDQTTPVMPSILPGLKGCATEGMFYNATTPEGLIKALSDMFGKAMASTAPDTVRLVD